MLGKLDSNFLKEQILNKLTKKRREVLLSGGIGEDCAIIQCNKKLLLTTDPISGASKNIGALSIHVSVNDICSSGGEPICVLLTLLAPVGTSQEAIAKVILQAEEECQKLDIDIVGGHTEITDAVNRIVVSCTAIGCLDDEVKLTSGMQNGDDIVMTKYAGLEGTSIIANDYPNLLKGLTENEIQEAKDCLKNISIKREAEIAKKFGVSAMHDITEGGVFSAVKEMSEASRIGVEVSIEKIPVLNITKTICSKLNLNPFQLISSGSLIIAVKNGTELVKVLKSNGINAEIIGKATKNNLAIAKNKNSEIELKVVSDEIFKLQSFKE